MLKKRLMKGSPNVLLPQDSLSLHFDIISLKVAAQELRAKREDLIFAVDTRTNPNLYLAHKHNILSTKLSGPCVREVFFFCRSFRYTFKGRVRLFHLAEEEEVKRVTEGRETGSSEQWKKVLLRTEEERERKKKKNTVQK